MGKFRVLRRGKQLLLLRGQASLLRKLLASLDSLIKVSMKLSL